MSSGDLEKVLALEKYRYFKEITTDDWRDPNVENAGFSISSKGWMDHRTGEKGSLASLLGRVVNVEGIYENSTVDDNDIEIIQEYFGGHRDISITKEFILDHGLKINRYKQSMSIVTPMRDIDGKIQCLHRIDLDRTFNKATASRLLGKPNRDRGILLRNNGKNLIQIEGLEDGVVVFQNKPDYDVLVTGPAVNFKRGKDFHKFYELTILLLDNDQDEASLKHSSYLGETVERVMPIDQGVDANLAHMQGCFSGWWKNLMDNKISWDYILTRLDDWNLGSHENIIEEFNRSLGIICVENRVVVLKETYDPYLKRDKVVLWSKADLWAWYADRFVDLIGGDGKVVRTNAAKYWFSHSKRRKFEGFTMEQETDKKTDKYYNLWKGLGYQSVKGDCSLFYEHMLENISCGDTRTYNYLLNWMADAVQNPLTQLPETALILRGKPGTGKTFFLNHFGKLFGPHYLYITNAKYLTGGFNGHLKDTIFLFADEAFLPTKDHYGILNGIVTQELTMIEFKGKDAFPFRNYIHLAMATNEKFVLPLNMDDRRFFMIKVGEKRKKDRGYFKDIEKQLKNGGYSALLYDLLHRDLTGVNLIDFPSTQTILDNKINGLNSVGQWIFQCLCTEEIPESKLPIADLYHKYMTFCQEMRIRIWTQPLWSREIKKYFPTLTRKRVSGSSQSTYDNWSDQAEDTVEGCRRIFAEKLNADIQWVLYE